MQPLADHFALPSLARIIELGIPDRAAEYFRGYWPVVERVYLTADPANQSHFALVVRFSEWAVQREFLLMRLTRQFYDDCQEWIPGLTEGSGVHVENVLVHLFGTVAQSEFEELAEMIFSV